MQLLPLELQLFIVELSSDSPSSLAALARTHPTYQREAERALYETLTIYASSDDSLKCMGTLATNPEKATLVRFLVIEYARGDVHNNQRVTTYISKSLINMHSLSDFRIRCRPGDESNMKRFGKTRLWSVCEIMIFSKLISNNSAGDTVEVIFNYKLFTVTTFSTLLKSLRVRPSCRYLDCIMAMREAFLKLSKNSKMLNYSFQSSLHWSARVLLQVLTILVSFRRSTLRIAVLQSINYWSSRFVKIKVVIWLPIRTTSWNSPSI